jgi:SNF2 family DNA or RNA helicase
MGTGKSKVTVDLAVNWGCRRILILCPLSVRDVWRREIPKHAAAPIDTLILEKGSCQRNAKDAAAFLARRRAGAAALVVNYDSAKQPAFAGWALEQEWDLVVCDEIHRIKDASSQVNKFCVKLAKHAKRRLGLTGTPMGNNPPDNLFGIFLFLDPGVFGTSRTRMRQHYAICGNPMIPQQVTGYKNLDDLYQRMAPLTCIVKNDVLDLPPVNHHTLECELSASGRAVYDQMRDEFIAELRSGAVTAANAMVKALRLRQITSGFLQPEEADRPESVDTSKAEALADLLEDLGPGEPVVVFGCFTEDLRRVQAVAKKLGRRYGEVSGARKDLTRTAEMPTDVDVLGVQVQAGGLGVDLSRACYAVWYNHPWSPWSLTDYDQATARVHRPGQTRPTHYYHLLCKGTIDLRVYRALSEKRDVVDSVLNLFRQDQGDEDEDQD